MGDIKNAYIIFNSVGRLLKPLIMCVCVCVCMCVGQGGGVHYLLRVASLVTRISSSDRHEDIWEKKLMPIGTLNPRVWCVILATFFWSPWNFLQKNPRSDAKRVTFLNYTLHFLLGEGGGGHVIPVFVILQLFTAFYVLFLSNLNLKYWLWFF